MSKLVYDASIYIQQTTSADNIFRCIFYIRSEGLKKLHLITHEPLILYHFTGGDYRIILYLSICQSDYPSIYLLGGTNLDHVITQKEFNFFHASSDLSRMLNADNLCKQLGCYGNGNN